MDATIKDIAQATGFSIATVSRVLANKEGFFSKSTAAKVNKAAKELGYQKNMAALELVTRRSDVIAVIINSTKTNFADAIIEGIQQRAAELGNTIIILYTRDRDEAVQRKAITTALERPVAGILLLSVDIAPDNVALLKSSNTPFYFVSIAFRDASLPCICSDDRAIGYMAAHYLLEHGHTRIGLAGLDLNNSYTGLLRLAGYRKAMEEAGAEVAEEWIHSGDFSYESGVDAMDSYHGMSERLSAVIAGSDLVAIGLLNRARHYGVDVPQNLSIVSIDGTSLCDYVQPPLSSVTQDFYRMGYISLGRLLEHDDEISFTDSHLVERDSVATLD
ncbi:MAG: LacI family DNA-binding transcriptional regulator [Bifidobacterium crudilactis]|jgi:LacI family transcriptional regulator|uniref:LacI family DNA-binding transcriptional regulator n=1 Tax=Bifidobacterium crudilactis TaxID=327277 RepID=UPI0023545C15|nr:LacI family DNA-binding transcriptional regulator [Bifidobacterium crudilactis]MCI1217947.1 LacI family transcriptional regulator [Bifidobacterium crudilactis]